MDPKPIATPAPTAIAVKILLATLLLVIVASFFAFGFHRYVTIDYFLAQQSAISTYYAVHPGRTAAAFILIYIFVAGLSLPGGLVLTVVAGNIFGLWWGTVLVSCASTVAATLAFLASRYFFCDIVQQHFGERLRFINEGMDKDGVFYLFSLRLLPVSPFLVINLVMGLTSMSTTNYILVSQVGMLIGAIVCVNAGTQIANIETLDDIVSPGLLGSLTLLAIFPFIAKRIVRGLKTRIEELRRPTGTHRGNR